eukprot:CAMPEP_0179123258 /NCGR_PEP_ID=MMETSP0796-20121207/58206_1 /TAXON_ID=73915 /ORGANISM="Pyrodinium bahamense, Strain pbaha01" /LENGTH=224 /DNA_ID=CAMNT_0020821901 /DNA_START=48 /DNA_END=718 /DNA_ORIENTATION=+
MAGSHVRRSAALLPVLLLGVGVWLVVVFVDPHGGVPFLTASQVAPASRTQGRTALRGFKEDFEAWRAALSPEEQALVQQQAQGEFNKKFRKSDEFKKDLPEEKVQSFAKILGKFFEAEAEDYKKEAEAKTPDYEGLIKKAGEKKMDFSLKNKIVEVNRDADRRYHFASMKIRAAEERGEMFPQSSPMQEKWAIQNNDTESHEKNLQVLEFIKKAMEDPSCPPDA